MVRGCVASGVATVWGGNQVCCGPFLCQRHTDSVTVTACWWAVSALGERGIEVVIDRGRDAYGVVGGLWSRGFGRQSQLCRALNVGIGRARGWWLSL